MSLERNEPNKKRKTIETTFQPAQFLPYNPSGRTTSAFLHENLLKKAKVSSEERKELDLSKLGDALPLLRPSIPSFLNFTKDEEELDQYNNKSETTSVTEVDINDQATNLLTQKDDEVTNEPINSSPRA